MHVLALDTTTRDGSVAIVEDDRVIFEENGDPCRPHAERLPGDLVRALAAASLSPSDIDVFAVVSGPGSFTGVRTGIATIQGMALVHGRRVVAVSTLEAIAEAVSLVVKPGALIGTWMDARRHSVFSALWRLRDTARFSTHRFEEVESARVGDPEETLLRWARGPGAPVVVAGDGAVLYAGIIGSGSLVVAAPPLASVVGLMAVVRARENDTSDPAGVQPAYVRRPDVEAARDAGR